MGHEFAGVVSAVGAAVAFECAGIDSVPASAIIALPRDGKVDAQQFVTGRIGLGDLVAGGFRQLIDHKEENGKILVSPKEVPA